MTRVVSPDFEWLGRHYIGSEKLCRQNKGQNPQPSACKFNNTLLFVGFYFKLSWFLFQSKNFLGKEALLRQKEFGISKKFCQFLIHGFDLESSIWPTGNEPIYRNGKLVGLTTSSAYGFTLGSYVCLGYINHLDDSGKPLITKKIHDYIKDPKAKYEIDVAGTRYPVSIGIYTPKKAYKASDKPTFIPVPGT